jgi:hypothetical protein
MKSYSEKLKDPRWQRKRLKVMERDGFECCDCGSADKSLTVHHCHYSKGGPWDTPDGFLLTLCQDCHATRQEVEDELKERHAGCMSNVPVDTLKHILGRYREAAEKGLAIVITIGPRHES